MTFRRIAIAALAAATVTIGSLALVQPASAAADNPKMCIYVRYIGWVCW
jgi:hypothetical protein